MDFVGNDERSPFGIGEGIVPGDGGPRMRLLVTVDDYGNRQRKCPYLRNGDNVKILFWHSDMSLIATVG